MSEPRGCPTPGACSCIPAEPGEPLDLDGAVMDWFRGMMDEAREEAGRTRRYAEWKRSPEGQANRAKWLGWGPESDDKDAVWWDAEVARYQWVLDKLTAQQQALRDARQRVQELEALVRDYGSGDRTEWETRRFALLRGKL